MFTLQTTASISTSAQEPQGLDEDYWMNKQKPNCFKGWSYFSVNVSYLTLDKGLAVFKPLRVLDHNAVIKSSDYN